MNQAPTEGEDAVDLRNVPIDQLVAELNARRPQRLCLELFEDAAALQEAVNAWFENKDLHDDESERDAYSAALRIQKLVAGIRRKARTIFRDIDRDARLPPLGKAARARSGL